MKNRQTIEIISEEDQLFLMDIGQGGFSEISRSKRPKQALRMQGRVKSALRSLKQLLRY